MTGDGELFAYLGHHKCATQWMNRIVQDMCRTIGRTRVIYKNARQFDRDMSAALPDPGSTFVCYVNAEYRFIKAVDKLRAFHVVRDPRDIVASAYFSHLHSHPSFPGLDEYREQLRTVTEAEGIMLELERRSNQFRAMLEWDYDDPDILELRMEDITTDTATALSQIAEFLGLGPGDGLKPKRLAKIAAANDFTVLAGRPPGEEDAKSHYRKGVPGDWVNHFTPEHVAYFKEHYGDLLLRLGYETSPHWG